MPSPLPLVLLLLLLLVPGAVATRGRAGQAGEGSTHRGQGEDGGRTLQTTSRHGAGMQVMERLRRGTEEDSKSVQQYVPGVRVEFPRPLNSASLHPTKALLPSSTDQSEQQEGVPTDREGSEPRANLTTVSDKRLQIQNPLYPVTENSYSAYAVMFLSLIVFAVGIIGNLSVMCIVWHNYYMKSAWNSILASLAFWDFLILFFCLPVVIFNEITKNRLLGDVSCRIVPFMEVRQSTGLWGAQLPSCFGGTPWPGARAVCPRDPHCGAQQGDKGWSQFSPPLRPEPFLRLCPQHQPCQRWVEPMKASFAQPGDFCVCCCPSACGLSPTVCWPALAVMGAEDGPRAGGCSWGSAGVEETGRDRFENRRSLLVLKPHP